MTDYPHQWIETGKVYSERYDETNLLLISSACAKCSEVKSVNAQKERVAELQARLFSLACSECGEVRGVYCPTCGRPMAWRSGSPRPLARKD